MNQETVRTTAFAMPPTSPTFPPELYRFVDRQYFIRYRTRWRPTRSPALPSRSTARGLRSRAGLGLG
jgi:acetoacetate decarboxylase